MGKRFTEVQLAKIRKIITDPEELELVLESDDPVRWLEKHFYNPDNGEEKFKVKKGFYPILRCNRRNRSLRTGRQVGKCLGEETKVQLPDGSLPSAKQLYEIHGEDGSFPISTTDPVTFKHKTSSAVITDNGFKPMVKIGTTSGFITENTFNHPYYIWRNSSSVPEWIEGKDILPGDRIAVSRSLEYIQGQSNITRNEAELLGYLVGDGGTSQHTIRFTSADIEIIERINVLLDNLNSNMILKKSLHNEYDYNFVIKDKEKHAFGPGSKSWITSFVETHRFAGKLAIEKEVPESIFLSSKSEIASFLGAYLSTDGWVCKLSHNNSTQIGVGSSSRKLIEGVRFLLLRLGIQSRLYEKNVNYNGETRKSWQLLIMDSRDILKFQSIIQPIHEKKKEELSNAIIKDNNSNTDTIPLGVWKYVDKRVKERGISKQSLLKEGNERIRYNYSPNRRKLESQTSGLDDTFLKAISSSDIMWDEVKSVEDAGEKQSYAISVLETENLITDGFITHNTVHLCGDILHNLMFNKDYTILIFVPEKKNMNRMLEIMSNMIRMSDLRYAFEMGKRKKQNKGDVESEYDYEIRCSSGSVARFFFMGNNPNKARGQHAHGIIYIDEAEYLPEKAYDVIAGFPKADPNISIWASSTPSGLPGTWFREFSDNCAKESNPNGLEFHIPTSSEENWAEIEPRLREIIFDEVRWNLEVLAIWTDAIGAVYKKDIIDQSVAGYRIGDMTFTMEELRETQEYVNAPKFLGVDWNVPQNGVRLVETSLMFGRKFITRHERISHELYTQTYTVRRILDLHLTNRYRKISVDSGYGETQIELLHDALLGMGQDPSKILFIISSVKKIKKEVIYTSTVTGTRKKDTIEMRVKTYIVSLLGRHLEESLVLPQEEDQTKTGLVSELRGFRRKENKKEAGAFEYTDNTHSVSALQMCIYGLDEWILENNRRRTASIDISVGAELDMIVKKRINQQRIYNVPAMSQGLGRRTGGLSGRSGRAII